MVDADMAGPSNLTLEGWFKEFDILEQLYDLADLS